MAISPQVFLCYGRPDREVAEAIVGYLWDHQVECYDYLAKPVEDRLGEESHHFRYLFEAKLFVALLSTETGARDLVIEELQVAAGVRAVSDDRRVVYICPPDLLREVQPTQTDPSLPVFAHLGRVDEPDLYIDRTRVGSTTELCAALLDVIPAELMERMQTAWTVNRGLYPDEFEALDVAITHRQPAASPSYHAADLLAMVTVGQPVDEFLARELGQIRDGFTRATFVGVLAQVLRYADEAMAEHLRRFSDVRRVLPEVNALVAEMRSSELSNQPLEQVADVLRGSARVAALLARGEAAEAAEVAEAVTWPLTQRVVLCGVYGCARSMGDADSAARVCEVVLQDEA